jgi:hypothetical protein
MSLASVVCSGQLNQWFKIISGDQRFEICSGFSVKEIVSILNLPIEVSNKILDDMTYCISDKFKFNSAALKRQSVFY